MDITRATIKDLIKWLQAYYRLEIIQSSDGQFEIRGLGACKLIKDYYQGMKSKLAFQEAFIIQEYYNKGCNKNTQ